jgi:hypothetical protein
MGISKPGRAVQLLAIAFVLAQVAVAAAHEPSTRPRQLQPSHFNGDDRAHGPDLPGGPDGDGGEWNEAQIASDRWDGIDRLWQVRAVASADTRYFEWYRCHAGGSAFDPDECTLILRDSTPRLSNPPPGIPQIAVFGATWDIPAARQFGNTFRVLACIDGPPATPAHCRGDRTIVHFDDSANTSDHPATTDNGQITRPDHGDAVSNDGFAAVAFTSETDVGRILFCLDIGTSPTTAENASPARGCDPGSARDAVPDDSSACDTDAATSGVQVPAGADCWSVQINPPNNEQFSLGIVEQDDPSGRVESGSGDCEGDTTVGGDGSNTGDDCQLDKIYLTSEAGSPASTAASCPGFANDNRNQVVGTGGPDGLRGSSRPDIICGLRGGDVLIGLAGNDLLLGGSGNDVLRGRRGRDALRGGRNDDLLRGGRGRDVLNGGRGRDRCLGGPGGDVFDRCESTG